MLRSLLLSRDENTVAIVSRVFRELDVELHHYSEVRAALSNAASVRYDAIVIDDCTEEAAVVSRELIELPNNGKSVRIVLAEPNFSMGPVFKAGIQVVLYKPLSADRVRHGLRAVRNLMARDRRVGGNRVRTALHARVKQGRNVSVQAEIVDLSETGAAIHLPSKKMLSARALHMDFCLPGDEERIHAAVELVWQDNKGAAGIRFADMATSSRKRLTLWVREHIETAERRSSSTSQPTSAV
jgi:hypothetical protein